MRPPGFTHKISQQTHLNTEKIAKQIVRKIRKVQKTFDPPLLIFADIHRELGSEILALLYRPGYHFDESCIRLHYSAPDRYLRIAIPTPICEAGVAWMQNEFTSWMLNDLRGIANLSKIACCRPTQDRFIGDYAGSRKVPDWSWTPLINSVPIAYPSVVLESGWVESSEQLIKDSHLWLSGTAGAVKVVILCKAFRPDEQNRVRATLTMCRATACGALARAHWQIFPVPAEIQSNPYITIDELLGAAKPPGLNPETQLPLCMEVLRGLLDVYIRKMGHIPA
ncbi:hypothetical protein HOY82DRAFT_634089 [Tuber indicum]|nr:hypothetical protein HOY82DRAFT_634089 [Tuber indicum]